MEDYLMSKPRVIISGIGTGGHYFPAAVVAQELEKHKVEVIFLVRKGYVEEEVAKVYGLKTFAINPKGFYGKPLLSKIVSLFSILYSICLLKTITKGVVGIAFGGFGALPLIIACIINGCPFYLFEPNRIPGRTTKLFSSRAKRTFLGLPLMTHFKGEFMVTGIPIRQEFKNFSKKRAGMRKKILFYGGSQGAERLNRLALGLQPILPHKYQIVIISGRRDYDWVKSRRNGRTRVISFTYNPWNEIQNADLVVSRSGALAGYEILSSNRPVIFIPFPFAIDDHQYYNADYFSKIGDAIVIREKDLTEKILANKIIKFISIGVKKRSEVILDAEKQIADVILKEIR
jgi:UDP-N-acetylglucosamine--N-acetylmuramyl-(pentapeptide) pyrophosphoryl-undecaprenol N-acetylglucosamine transferase